MPRLPIFAGPLRGRWWLAESRGKILRILNGTYEPEQTALFREHVRPGGTVLDVGAHVGYYTLLASTLVGDEGAVWSFEPDAENGGFLRRHVEINRLANVRVEPAAVSDRTGTASFAAGTGSGTGHLEEGGDVEVRTVRLDEFCPANDIAPTAVKIDVEGAEADVLRGARETLARHRPVVFLSTHGDDAHRASLAVLRELGYSVRPILGDDVETTAEVLALPPAE